MSELATVLEKPKNEVLAECLPTPQDVAFYEVNGYWIAPRIFSDAELAALREHQDRVYAGIHETGRAPWGGGWKFNPKRPDEIRKTDNSYWADLTLRRAVLNPTVGAIAARLHHERVVRLWHDQLLYKPPGGKDAGNVGWHQDYGYWRACREPHLLTAWLALSDVTVENGTIQVVPGSHKRGLLNASDFFNQNLEHLQQAIEAESGRHMHTVPLVMRAGQVSFHHCLTIHGSGPNHSSAPRRSMAIHLMAGVVHRTLKGKHMNTELVDLKEGEPFIGEAFPVVYGE